MAAPTQPRDSQNAAILVGRDALHEIQAVCRGTVQRAVRLMLLIRVRRQLCSLRQRAERSLLALGQRVAAFDLPTCSGTFHPVFHKMLTGVFCHAASERIIVDPAGSVRACFRSACSFRELRRRP